MGIFDKLRRKKIVKTLDSDVLSREQTKILGRDKRLIEHGRDKADISAQIVTRKVKQLEIQVEPRQPVQSQRNIQRIERDIRNLREARPQIVKTPRKQKTKKHKSKNKKRRKK